MSNLTHKSPGLYTWLRSLIFMYALGAAASFYSLLHHYELKAKGATNAFCNISSQLNCDKVASSSYSEFFSIPMGTWGLAYFFAMLFILWFVSRGKKQEVWELIFLFFASIGVIFSLVLASISFFILKVICITCILVYLCVFFQVIPIIITRKKNFGAIKKIVFKSFFFYLLLPTTVVFVVLGINVFFNKNKTPASVEKKSNSQLITKKSIPLNLNSYSPKGMDYYIGNKSAKVVVVEFADFQCPACRTLSSSLKKIRDDYKDSVLFVFKNYPLDNSCNANVTKAYHEHACSVAIMARCAGIYNKFWQYHDLAFSEQQSIGKAAAEKWAYKIGLSKKQIESCLQNTFLLDKLKEDIKIADSIGVQGTPALYINGIRYTKSYAELGNEIGKIVSTLGL
jgi:protein-disulfide isomerase/uncharacterized membrane protein